MTAGLSLQKTDLIGPQGALDTVRTVASMLVLVTQLRILLALVGSRLLPHNEAGSTPAPG